MENGRKGYTVEKDYIEMMIQSLQKKQNILEQILVFSKKQQVLLENPNLEPDEFDENVEQKAACIEQLEQLDQGFEQLFERVREALNKNRSQYAAQIEKMQNFIREITALSAQISTQEARNKDLMTRKFTQVHEQARSIRSSQKVVKQYYDNMMKMKNYAPQFLDNKK